MWFTIELSTYRDITGGWIFSEWKCSLVKHYIPLVSLMLTMVQMIIEHLKKNVQLIQVFWAQAISITVLCVLEKVGIRMIEGVQTEVGRGEEGEDNGEGRTGPFVPFASPLTQTWGSMCVCFFILFLKSSFSAFYVTERMSGCWGDWAFARGAAFWNERGGKKGKRES